MSQKQQQNITNTAAKQQQNGKLNKGI